MKMGCGSALESFLDQDVSKNFIIYRNGCRPHKYVTKPKTTVSSNSTFPPPDTKSAGGCAEEDIWNETGVLTTKTLCVNRCEPALHQ